MTTGPNQPQQATANGSRYAGYRYESEDFYLLRTPALPVQTFREVLAGARELPGATPDELRASTRAKLRELAAEPQVRRALLVASPDLAHALPRLDADPDAKNRKTQRVYSRLLRYLIRMTTRPTPFGGFSGVALGKFGESTDAALGASALGGSRIRADMGWLLALIQQIEDDQQARPHLRVVLNSTVYLSSERAVLPSADVYGRNDGRAVRIRATTAVHATMQLTRTPIPYPELIDQVAKRFPDVPKAKVHGLVDEMWQLNYLISDLRPPLTAAFPERHVAAALAEIPTAAHTSAALNRVIELAERAAHGDADDLAALRQAQRAMVSEHQGQTYQLDSTVDLRTPHLSAEIGAAAADAMGCLMRLSHAVPGHNYHLAQYRDAFIDRYGNNALIPVSEVLSAEQGLDAPPSYTQPERSSPLPDARHQPDAGDYERMLTVFAAEAWWNSTTEVELTDEWLERFAPDAPATEQDLGLFPALDAYVHVQATGGRAGLNNGDWRIVLREESLAFGGRTYGRFYDLLGDEAVQRLRRYAEREEAISPDAVYAELCYVPAYGKAGNVAVRPQLRGYEVPINTTPSVPRENVIALDDILLGATEARFFLWSKRLDKELRVSQTHMLSPAVAPNVARFLLEVSNDGYVMPTGFRWGPLDSMPFLPRVVRHKAVLRPAQWTLAAETVGDYTDFAEAVARWRERWRVPRYVYLLDEDNRLLLDLEHPLSVDELETEFGKDGNRVTVQEMLPAFEEQWLTDSGGRVHTDEIVVPLFVRDGRVAERLTIGPPPGADLTENTARRSVVRRNLPGGRWTFLKLYAPFERHDEIIAGSLQQVVADLRAAGLIDRWFYLRYGDPQPHLRIRFRASEEAGVPEIFRFTTGWAGEVIAQGNAYDLALGSFHPEVERYGGPETYDAVERFFEANSDVAAQLVSLLDGEPDTIKPHFATVLGLNTLYAQWGLAAQQRMELIPQTGDAPAAMQEFHDNRDYLCELLEPWDPRPHPEGRADHHRLSKLLQPQQQAVADAARAVELAETEYKLWSGTATVLGSMAHMQVNRMMAVDLPRETHCYALWHHILRALRGRPKEI